MLMTSQCVIKAHFRRRKRCCGFESHPSPKPSEQDSKGTATDVAENTPAYAGQVFDARRAKGIDKQEKTLKRKKCST